MGMDRKIHKGNKKIIKILQRVGFRSPYQVIVEDKFVTAVNKSMLRLKHITDLFKSQPKLFTTKCIYKKYEKDGKKYKNDFSRYLEILNCNHEEIRDPLSCLKKVIKRSNKNHYILGSNCLEITDVIGVHKGIPSLTCKKGSLILNADVKDIPMYSSFRTEANEEELGRLESLFPNDEVAEEEINPDS